MTLGADRSGGRRGGFPGPVPAAAQGVLHGCGRAARPVRHRAPRRWPARLRLVGHRTAHARPPYGDRRRPGAPGLPSPFRKLRRGRGSWAGLRASMARARQLSLSTTSIRWCPVLVVHIGRAIPRPPRLCRHGGSPHRPPPLGRPPHGPNLFCCTSKRPVDSAAARSSLTPGSSEDPARQSAVRGARSRTTRPRHSGRVPEPAARPRSTTVPHPPHGGHRLQHTQRTQFLHHLADRRRRDPGQRRQPPHCEGRAVVHRHQRHPVGQRETPRPSQPWPLGTPFPRRPQQPSELLDPQPGEGLHPHPLSSQRTTYTGEMPIIDLSATPFRRAR